MKLLFERLSESREYLRDYSPRAAVLAQLGRLVATHLRADPEAEPDVANPGLPAVVTLGAGDAPALARYAERLRALIERGEPRLADVRIEVAGGGGRLAPLRLVVEARLRSVDDPEPVRFPIALPAH